MLKKIFSSAGITLYASIGAQTFVRFGEFSRLRKSFSKWLHSNGIIIDFGN